MREELLADDLQAIVRQLALAEDWNKQIMVQLDSWAQEEAVQTTSARDSLQEQIKELGKKIDRLLDAHLDNIVSREEYLVRKNCLLYDKTSLQEQLGKVSNGASFWLEPARQFFQTIFQADSIVSSENLLEVAAYLKTTGSNLTLLARKPQPNWEKPWSLVANFDRSLSWLTSLYEIRTWLHNENGSFLNVLPFAA